MFKNKVKNLGSYCKQYRENTLNISLTDFAKRTESDLKNVSAFEHGKANNIMYLCLYYKMTPKSKRQKLINDMFNVLNEEG